jgi:Zn-dependent peptidase ImmA (M78 family)
MAEADFAEFLRSPPKRKETIVHKLSRELLVPEILLFANEVRIPDTRLPDFRLSQPAPDGYSRETLKWIDFARFIQDRARTTVTVDNSRSLKALLNSGTPIPRAASVLRDVLNFTHDEQLAFSDARLMYATLRQRVEMLNVFVFQFSFPETDGTGFCLSGSPLDIIVVNTRKQTPARRSFSLAHEIYHCVLDKDGMSDAYVANNRTERQCNTFAVHFLTPAELVRRAAATTISRNTFVIDELKRFADTLNISMNASLLRLVELGIYDDSAIGAWKRFIERQGDPEAPRKRAGGTPQDEWKNKLSKYGFKFASVFGSAKVRGDLDELEFFRLSGIKPKYQDDYIKNASRARAEDADVDEGEEDA